MRKKESLKVWANIVFATIVSIIIFSCASIGRPSGGPKDEDPPVYQKSTPAINALNVTSKSIEITFDEIILVPSTESVVISPPQKEMPKISTISNRIYIDLVDSLLPETTYTIDFDEAIKDNNEGNILESFTLSFSTGTTIDSLQIGGIVLNAEDLEPVTGMTVGIHSSPSDTMFTTAPFERIGYSNTTGKFSIKNIKEGEYRLYGVVDADRDYKLSSPSENIAIYPSIITPTLKSVTRTDTIKGDTIGVRAEDMIITKDSIFSVTKTEYYPDTITLLAFSQGYKSQYIADNERKRRQQITLNFALKNDELPQILPVNFESEKDSWYIIERSLTNDSITYWITDSTIYNIDTLQVSTTYKVPDSLQNPIPRTDTLELIYRENVTKSRAQKRREENDSTPKITFLDVELKVSNSTEVYAKPQLKFSDPVDSISAEAYRLLIQVDTTWVEVKREDYKLAPDSLSPRVYRLLHNWKFGERYHFIVDSAAITSNYDIFNDSYEKKFGIRKSDEYSNLYIETTGVTDGAFVQLLDKSDKVVRKSTVRNGGAEFALLRPSTYYARIIFDRDGNGEFTTGSVKENRPPEVVFYYPKSIELRANWDVEQLWDVYSTPLTKQKPRELIQNKAATKKDKEEPLDSLSDDPIYSNRPSSSLTF